MKWNGIGKKIITTTTGLSLALHCKRTAKEIAYAQQIATADATTMQIIAHDIIAHACDLFSSRSTSHQPASSRTRSTVKLFIIVDCN